MKKFISLALAALLSTLLCACGGVQASPVEDFEYEFEDGEVTITGYIGSDLEIVIPETIDDRPVTVIGEEAFEDYDMKSVAIPNTVNAILNYAFSGCSNLEKVTTYGNTTTIALDDEATDEWLEDVYEWENSSGNLYEFYNNYDIYNYGTHYFLEGDAFSYCTSLVSIEIPKSILGIQDLDFWYASEITVPENVIYIRYLSYQEKGHEDYPDYPTVRGKKGSYAETYVEEHNEEVGYDHITFVAE